MSTIPPNNTSGLYGIDGNAIPVGGNIDANNINATGNVTVGGYIIANGSITTNANFVGDLVGNVTGNITLSGSNTQVIYNDQGVTGGSNAFTFNDSTNVVTVGGNVTATGNIQGSFILGNGSQLTGLPQQYGNANVVTLLAAFGSNTVNTTGNITGGYILGNGSQLTGLPQQYGNANVAAFLDSGTNTLDIITTATVEGSRLQTSGAAGNITGANYIGANFFVGDGSLLTNVASSYGNAQVANYLASGTNSANIVTTGNVSGQYILGDGSQLTGLAATYGNANVNAHLAAFGSNTIVTTGNITGGNIIGDGSQLTNLPVQPGTYGNGNVTTLLSAFGSNTVVTTGNITGGYFIGNGSQLTGLPATYGNAEVAAFLPTYTGNLAGGNLAIGNNANILNDLTVGGTIYGTFAGNISGNLVVPGANTDVIFNNSGNAGASSDFTFNDATNTMIVNGTANVSTLNVSGNISGGNVATTGNISGSYILGNGSQLTGLPATYTDSNVTTLLASFGSNSISTTGNITAGNFVGNGSQLTSITGANITGTVANATFATSAGTAGTVTTNAQPNITSVGTLTSLGVTGNIGTGGILTDGYYYANGTPVTFGGGSYGDSNVVTLMSAFGSNTITTTGNVTVGNLNMTGQVFDSSGVLQLNAAGNIVMAPTGSVQINGPTDIIGGKLTTGAVTYANVDGTNGQVLTTFGNGITYFSTVSGGSYGDANVNTLLASWGSNTLSTTGNVTAGNVSVTGNIVAANLGNVSAVNLNGNSSQVLYGNGVFAAVSGGGGSPGGSDSQIQFNDGGSFGGNVAMTFDDATGNVTLGNIVIQTNQQMQTVAAYSGNSSVRNPGQITIGNGYDGNITNTTFLTVNARNARALSYDKYIKVDNGQRNSQLAALTYADLNGGNIGTANAASRIVGIVSDVFAINGNSINAQPSAVRSIQGFVTAGTSANTGNANLSGCQVNQSFVSVNAGSRIGNAWMYFAESGNNGNVLQSPLDTYIGYGIRPGHTANTTTGNVFGVYMPGTTATYGSSIGNGTRQASQYYFLRNDDDLAQNKLGSLRTFHEYRYDNSSSSGTLTVDKNNGQVQYVTVSEDITTVSFSNFVVSATDGTTTDYQTDTVTLIFQQDATGRTITLPTPSTTYKYAGGVSVMGTTANAVQMVSVTATYNAGLAGTQYLITVSPEFS